MTEQYIYNTSLNRIVEATPKENECSIEEISSNITEIKIGKYTITFQFDDHGNLEGLTPTCED